MHGLVASCAYFRSGVSTYTSNLASCADIEARKTERTQLVAGL